jgi:hypothetical protein
MFAAGISHRVKTRERTADASHPELQKYADCGRKGLHYLVDRAVEANSHWVFHPHVIYPAWPSRSLSQDKLFPFSEPFAVSGVRVEIFEKVDAEQTGNPHAVHGVSKQYEPERRKRNWTCSPAEPPCWE